MLVFREIEQLFHDVTEGLSPMPSQEELSLNEERRALLRRVVTYTNDFSWLSHRALVAKVRTFLKSRYSYQAVAQEYGLTVKQAHKAISYASDRLRSRIGGILHLIQSGHIAAAQRELAVLTGGVDFSAWFLKEVSDRFQPTKDAGVVVGEVSRRELAFLRLFSQTGLTRAVSSLQAPVVQHILYILSSSDATYLREKEWIWRYLIDGTASIDECIRGLNDDFVWGGMSD